MEEKKLLKRSQRILVVRLDEIGDFVMTTPFLRELRANLPEANITLVVKGEVRNLAQTCPYVDRVRSCRPRKWSVGPTQHLKCLAAQLWFSTVFLRKERFDLALVPRSESDFSGAIPVMYYSGSRDRVGYAKAHAWWKEVSLLSSRYLNHTIEDPPLEHEVEKNLQLLRSLGGNVENDALELWLTPEDHQMANGALAPFRERGTPLIALAVGASQVKKIWPAALYGQMCGRLHALTGAQFLIIGGKEDFSAGEQVHAVFGKNVLNLCGKLTLRQSTAVIAACDLLIGNDSGPKHLAAAVHTPVVEVSCLPEGGSCTNENHPCRFGVWQCPTVVVRPKNPLPPCTDGSEAWGAPHYICSVTPDAVVEASLSLLEKSRAF